MLSIGFHAEAPARAAVAAAPLDARIEGLGRSFPITRPTFGIGRGAECDLVIEHDAVASLHAQIERHGDALYLRDAGSRTGTWANGRALTTAHALADGDLLRIGPAELWFRSPALARKMPAESSALAPELCLEVRSGQSVGLSFALRGESSLVGSLAGAGVELRDLSVAPQHARVRKSGGQHFVSDLGSGYGTFLNGAPLPPLQEFVFPEGAWLRLGAVDLVLVRGAVLTAALLRPRARLSVDSGPGAGMSLGVVDGALVGSGPQATLVIPGLAPLHLELALRGRSYFVRDRSGGGSFRRGTPLGPEFVELGHGDALLLQGSTMLRFEELP